MINKFNEIVSKNSYYDIKPLRSFIECSGIITDIKLCQGIEINGDMIRIDTNCGYVLIIQRCLPTFSVYIDNNKIIFLDGIRKKELPDNILEDILLQCMVKDVHK